ncbi:hypothetical protein [Hymenobacter metallicola]|uniref:Uncharacterized protein n=1 Tax=Hymenobacter metallicola TaxID=2563114 RepID=A0A4Z0QLA7_9BACT|nr:hypothetical protein [Hymenobacter metallicola]TGE29831.1 hypothetical protein E5K02_10330 [Hymenobacter metallicola]
MPKDSKNNRRSVPVGTYSNATQTRGKAGNVTQQFLEEVGHDQRGMQELYREAIRDIADPLNPGKTLTYGQLLAGMRTPEGVKRAEAYGRAMGLNRTMTPVEHAQAEFDAGRGRLLAAAEKNPGQLAFAPEAVEAYMAPRRAAYVNETQYANDPLARYFAAQGAANTANSVAVAPGTATRRLIKLP